MDNLKKQTFQYNRAKTWQIALFSLNNTATNSFQFLMGFVAYYTNGFLGLGVVFLSNVLMFMRIWDAVIDPFLGVLVDKTSTRFGKFRPFMIGGYICMSISLILIFFTNHLLPSNFQLIYFILIHMIYIVGYSLQTISTKAAQTVLTNDPKQRPLFASFDIPIGIIFFAVAAQYISGYLSPKYGGFELGFFKEFVITIIIFNGILTILSVIGIWNKDNPKFYPIGENAEKVKFSDMWNLIKSNKPLKMMIFAAAADKIALRVSNNSIVMILLFGIVIGDYSIYGQMSMITIIPSILSILAITQIARKNGTRDAFIKMTYACIAIFVALFVLLLFGDPTSISLTNINFMTIAFFLLYSFGYGFRMGSGGLVNVMVPDISDYELYRSGKYVPGMVSTTYSFVDQLVSSFSQIIIGYTLALVGYDEVLPDQNTPYTETLFWITMFLFIGILVLGWILSLVAMRYYELDAEKMKEVQIVISERKNAAKENS